MGVVARQAQEEQEIIELAVALARLRGVSWTRYRTTTTSDGLRYAWELIVEAVQEALGVDDVGAVLGDRRWRVFDRVYQGVYRTTEAPWRSL